MWLDFKAVQAGRSTQRFSVAPDDPLLEGFFGRPTAPLEVVARVREQPHRSFLVELHVRGEVEAPCGRCLKAVRQPIDGRVTLLAEVRDRGAATPAGEDDEGDVLVLRSLHDRVDLGPALREALFLSADAYVLCDEACRGLCPRCGEDLNDDACACGPEVEPEPHAGTIRIRGA
jgi:uncharacterized protein